jgi:hypothetical protein
MKKILAFIILCACLIGAVSVIASAEDTPADAVENGSVTEQLPTEEENVTEDGDVPPESAPEIEKTEANKPLTEIIVEWVKTNLEEISVVVTLLGTIFYEVRKHGKLNGSIGTLNNNAVAIAKDSSTAISSALTKVEDIAKVVEGYKNDISALLDEIRNSEEEKKALKIALDKVETYISTAKMANIEFANELAELLCLANIPNSKKDELYARHMDGVHKLEEAEGVTNNDGSEI